MARSTPGVAVLTTALLALAACSDSSSSARIAVNTSTDREEGDPTLIVDVRVHDDDCPGVQAPAGGEGAEPRTLQAATLGTRSGENGMTAPAGELVGGATAATADLAYVVLDAEGRAQGIGLADESGWELSRIAPTAIAPEARLAWAHDREMLAIAAGDGIHLIEHPGDTTPSTSTERIVDLPSASALDWGPPLELEGTIFSVILAVAPAVPGALEDVHAVYLDASGALLGVQNLTETPTVRELGAVWLHDGTRMAVVMERAEYDEIAVHQVAFAVEVGEPGWRAEPGPATIQWTARAGTLGEVAAARTGDLLAVAAWSGRDWDVLCLPPEGDAVNLGAPGLDEFAPSWSHDDMQLAIEHRCDSPACAPVRVWTLDPAVAPDRCPQVVAVRDLEVSASGPAWRP